METENELNNDIFKAMTAIEDKFPELSKYITEMPVTVPNKNNPEMNSKELKDYKDSLNTLLEKYASNQDRKKNSPSI